ncbi:MAG: hypothetical protein M0Q15_16410 [Nevskia sp.]|nr:hypothetical protein [Nevskia sp.]
MSSEHLKLGLSYFDTEENTADLPASTQTRWAGTFTVSSGVVTNFGDAPTETGADGFGNALGNAIVGELVFQDQRGSLSPQGQQAYEEALANNQGRQQALAFGQAVDQNPGLAARARTRNGGTYLPSAGGAGAGTAAAFGDAGSASGTDGGGGTDPGNIIVLPPLTVRGDPNASLAQRTQDIVSAFENASQTIANQYSDALNRPATSSPNRPRTALLQQLNAAARAYNPSLIVADQGVDALLERGQTYLGNLAERYNDLGTRAASISPALAAVVAGGYPVVRVGTDLLQGALGAPRLITSDSQLPELVGAALNPGNTARNIVNAIRQNALQDNAVLAAELLIPFAPGVARLAPRLPGIGSALGADVRLSQSAGLTFTTDVATYRLRSPFAPQLALAASDVGAFQALQNPIVRVGTESQIAALNNLGVPSIDHPIFFSGGIAGFQYPTVGGDNVFGFLQYQNGTLTSQLFSINNTAGGAPAAFRQFINGSNELGRSLGLKSLELQGGSVINRDLANALSSRGFTPKLVPVPDALGGGTQEVLSKVVSVRY